MQLLNGFRSGVSEQRKNRGQLLARGSVETRGNRNGAPFDGELQQGPMSRRGQGKVTSPQDEAATLSRFVQLTFGGVHGHPGRYIIQHQLDYLQREISSPAPKADKRLCVCIEGIKYWVFLGQLSVHGPLNCGDYCILMRCKEG